ncbi:aminotransferase class IV [Hwanghaeella sp.]|uniref:aminotransferase class IV n=1 Tax=Hwanghaeella sp. TaxID=2605943 RepID=UPI003CCC455B
MAPDTPLHNERVVYLNGEIIPESRALLSFRDTGFVYGDAVFDTGRTFGGKGFLLKEHVDRLYETLAYVRIDPGMPKEEMLSKTEEVLAINAALLGPDGDYWVTQRVSRGVSPVDGEAPEREGATVLIECMPLPLRARAAMFRDGIDAVVASLKRTPPSALSPNAKTNNYMNMMLAQREVASYAPGAWAVLLDETGNICEGAGCNIFVVKNGTVYTPSTEYILDGITRQVAIDLCGKDDIPVIERPLSLHSVAVADEAFFTSTSLCICPLRSFNGQQFGATPGPVTKRLMTAFSEMVGHDYVGQYLKHLSSEKTGTGF